MRPGYFSAIGCVWLLTLGAAMAQDTKLSLSAQQRGERGIAQHQKGNFEEAISEYSAAIKMDPNNAALLHNRGLSELSLQKYEQAGADFDKAIALDPKNAWLYNARGGLQLLRGNPYSARADFSKAIALDASVTAFHDNFRKAGGVEQVQGPAPPDDAIYTARSPKRPQQALERPLPEYDVERHCQEFASGSSYSYLMKNACVDMEQEAYNKLVIIWGTLPYNVADHCTDTGGFTGGGYNLLEACVAMQLEEKARPHYFRSAP